MANETIGIMGAIKDEISWLFPLLEDHKIETIGSREYHIGKFNSKDVVALYSEFGKVAISVATTTLITKFNVNKIIFVGIAGSLKEDLSLGDIVIGKNFYQHDMDARPALKKFTVPLQNTPFIKGNEEFTVKAQNAISKFIENQNFKNLFKDDVLAKFNIIKPKLFIEDIATGDVIVIKKEAKVALAKSVPSAFAVEMEGGAIAQVCSDFNIPFLVIRVISDPMKNVINKFELDVFLNELINVYFKEILTLLLQET